YKFKLESIFRNSGQNKLIIKPYMGHAGRGIDMAIKHGNKILIRTDGEELDIANYKLSEKAIIQEVVIQDERIAKISASSVNTIRVVTFYTKSDDVIIVSASMRFGVGTSIVDNWSSGGIAVGINHETGKLMRVAYDKHGNEYHAHPDSGVVFSTYQIQPWEQILQVAETVQKACPFYRMIGVDIAISKDGPVLIEVNANPDIVFQEQTAGPLLKNKKVLNAFAEDDLLINKYQKMLLKST
ncbi:MAG: hypothetical protein OEY89_18870, partial [Gammaproteobacteria bacterium]|nr:hypothetical protein [Gammaproteobacteria bacterium]